jgi:hypothetical protein
MKIRINAMRFSLAFLGVLTVLGGSFVIPATALELSSNEYIGTTGELSFEHKDRDVASELAPSEEDPFVLSYEGPFYTDSPEETYASYNEPDNNVSLSESGALANVPGDVEQPDADTTTAVQTTKTGTQLNYNIDLGVSGNSAYNKTTIGPQHYEEDAAAGYNPPDPAGVQNGDLKYYNNWEMTSADSHAYGGYGGGNAFSIAGDQDGVTEQFWVSASFSFGYDLSGEWTYQHIQNDDGVEFDERTGYFWTSFQTGLAISGDGQQIFSSTTAIHDLRNEMTDQQTFETVSQSRSYTNTMTFSFLATEGVDYTFDFFADLYGYADGIASYDSSGWANLALDISAATPVATPEPATSLLLGLGLVGILAAYRKRFRK